MAKQQINFTRALGLSAILSALGVLVYPMLVPEPQPVQYYGGHDHGCEGENTVTITMIPDAGEVAEQGITPIRLDQPMMVKIYNAQEPMPESLRLSFDANGDGRVDETDPQENQVAIKEGEGDYVHYKAVFENVSGDAGSRDIIVVPELQLAEASADAGEAVVHDQTRHTVELYVSEELDVPEEGGQALPADDAFDATPDLSQPVEDGSDVESDSLLPDDSDALPDDSDAVQSL